MRVFLRIRPVRFFYFGETSLAHITNQSHYHIRSCQTGINLFSWPFLAPDIHHFLVKLHFFRKMFLNEFVKLVYIPIISKVPSLRGNHEIDESKNGWLEK